MKRLATLERVTRGLPDTPAPGMLTRAEMTPAHARKWPSGARYDRLTDADLAHAIERGKA